MVIQTHIATQIILITEKTIPTQPNTSSDEDYGYRKSSSEKTDDNSSSTKRKSQPATEQNINKTELDGTLPQSKVSDRELLKMNAKDLDIE
jgi:hypothetical protein